VVIEDAKQWLVSRIDHKHEIYLEELSIEEARIESISDSVREGVRNGRNYLLSVAGIVLTILLGLLSANQINPLGFYLYLGIDFFCGFIVFIITNKISSYYERIFNTLSEIDIDAQTKISYSRAYFTNQTDNLEKLNSEHLKNYSLFVTILLDAALVPFFIALERLSANIFLPQDERNTIKGNADKLKKEIDAALTLFQSINITILPQDLVTYVKTQFTEYQKVQQMI
jgi:hypothetical protein